MVAVCGKNAKLQQQLEQQEWGGVHVVVRGFVKQMSDYMEVRPHSIRMTPFG